MTAFICICYCYFSLFTFYLLYFYFSLFFVKNIFAILLYLCYSDKKHIFYKTIHKFLRQLICEEWREIGREEGLALGREQGVKTGVNNLSHLLKSLQDNGETEKLQRAISDNSYLEQLYQEYFSEAAKRSSQSYLRSKLLFL